MRLPSGAGSRFGGGIPRREVGSMLNERDRRELAAIERQLRSEDPVLDRTLSGQQRPPRRWVHHVWSVGAALLTICAGAVGGEGFLVAIGIVLMFVAILLAFLELDEDEPHDGLGHPT